jgi:hypothetical protein
MARRKDWSAEQKRTASPGDSASMPAGVIYATFGIEGAKVIAILVTCAGEMGVEQVAGSGEAPWNGLGSNTAQEQQRSIEAYEIRLATLGPRQ